jgi:hypothetical protein
MKLRGKMCSARSKRLYTHFGSVFDALDGLETEKAIFLVLPQTLRIVTAEQLQ